MPAIEAERRAPLPTRMAIVAMGRFGGDELGFGSDADVMFVHDPLPGRRPARTPRRAARDVANEFRRLLALPGTDPALDVDADLRPEGKQGPLVRTLESYAALLRAAGRRSGRRRRCCAPSAIVGDEDLCRRFTELIDPLRFPAGGHHRGRRPGGAADQGPGRRRAAAARGRPGHPPQARARRAGRRRVDRPAAADAARRRRCRRCAPPGPSTRCRPPSRPTCSARRDAEALSAAWRTASGLRNAITQVRGKPADSLPRDTRERAAVAHIRGYRAGGVRPAGQRLPAGHPAGPPGRRAGVLGLRFAAFAGQPRREPLEQEAAFGASYTWGEAAVWGGKASCSRFRAPRRVRIADRCVRLPRT